MNPQPSPALRTMLAIHEARAAGFHHLAGGLAELLKKQLAQTKPPQNQAPAKTRNP